jgi:hypothetical protein
VAAGCLLGLVALIVYAAAGYSRAMHGIWLAAFLALAFGFWARTTGLPRLQVRDVVAATALVCVFAPLYLVHLYDWPVQVGSDEVVISFASSAAAHMPGADPFGLSSYAGNPTLWFLVLGRLGGLLGGVELENMRLLHALTGLAAIVGAYVFFRQLLSRPWAITATCVLGINHSLLMISRMAERETSALLIEVVALAALCIGLRYGDGFYSYLGGALAGLGFYVYYPGRVVFPLWVIFLGALATWLRGEVPARRLASMAVIAATGFVLVACPVLIANVKAPPGATEHQDKQLLLFQAGRELQKDWVFAPTQWEGIKRNIVDGLGAYNNNVVDRGWIYPNYGHGFVDPLTGGLLWLGVLVVGVDVVRRRAGPWPLLPLGSFLLLWLTLALLVNKAPNYTRMLITLPFVAFFVAEALRRGSGLVQRRLDRRGSTHGARVAPTLAVAAVAVIAAWNLAIAWDYIEVGRTHGDDIGSTGRYIQAHRDVPGQHFYLAASDRRPYYVWGFPFMYEDRMRFFARDGEVGGIVSRERVASFTAEPPFSLFMSRQLWLEKGRPLLKRYPDARLRDVTPDGRLVVLEGPPRPAVSG